MKLYSTNQPRAMSNSCVVTLSMVLREQHVGRLSYNVLFILE